MKPTLCKTSLCYRRSTQGGYCNKHQPGSASERRLEAIRLVGEETVQYPDPSTRCKRCGLPMGSAPHQCPVKHT